MLSNILIRRNQYQLLFDESQIWTCSASEFVEELRFHTYGKERDGRGEGRCLEEFNQRTNVEPAHTTGAVYQASSVGHTSIQWLQQFLSSISGERTHPIIFNSNVYPSTFIVFSLFHI